jgi:DNA-binding CsgD family transcriptional regulator
MSEEGRALLGLACVVRISGDLARASELIHKALDSLTLARNQPDLLTGVEDLAGVLACQGQLDQAARLLGAGALRRRATGHVRGRIAQVGYDQDIALVRSGLGRAVFDQAFSEGGTLPMAAAVEYAKRNRGARNRHRVGWASLTRAERRVATLASEGLPNTEIGRRLFISPRTVGTHLQHVFAKLEINSRMQLPRFVPQDDITAKTYVN